MKCRWLEVCPLRRFEKQGKLTDKWRNQYCEKDFKKCKRYQLTDKCIHHPDNMLPDGTVNKKL